MRRYFKLSLGLHGIVFAALVAWTLMAPLQAQKRMKFVILPKGTSLNAQLTQEVLDAMKNPDAPPGTNTGTPKPSPSPQPICPSAHRPA